MDNQNQTETTKQTTYRGSMKRAMDYINSNSTLRVTPESLASAIGVPAMSAYRALRTATAAGQLKIEKVKAETKTRGPSKNVYIRA